MLKDKISSAIPPEDVIIRNSKLGQALLDPAIDRFFVTYKWPLRILAAVLAVALIVVGAVAIRSMPIPSDPVDLTMHAARMGENGTRLDEGSVVIRGQRLDFRDESVVSEFDVTEFRVFDIEYLPKMFSSITRRTASSRDSVPPSTRVTNCRSKSLPIKAGA